jgi:hypothetical protein
MSEAADIPRRGRLRFGMKTVLAVPVVVALLVALADASHQRIMYGTRAVPLAFEIVDAGTGRSISRASIRIDDGSARVYTATSDPEGRAKIELWTDLYVRVSLLRTVRTMNYLAWTLEVRADGYRPLRRPMGELTTDRRYHEGRTPPPS